MFKGEQSKEFLGPLVRAETARQIREARKDGLRDKAEEISEQHHERAKATAEAVESRLKERSVAEWIKKGLVFAHGMPLLESQILKSAPAGNNKELAGKTPTALERLNYLLEKNPVISASTLSSKRYRLGAAYPAGVLLADGFLQQGYTTDEGTMALDRQTRVSMYQKPADRVKVQDKVEVERIEEVTDAVGQRQIENGGLGSVFNYNEYVISKPAVSTLFLDLDYYDDEKYLKEWDYNRKKRGLEPAGNENRKYVSGHFKKEKTESLLALLRLSRATGLPVVGLKSEGGNLKITELEIDDKNFIELTHQAENLENEISLMLSQGKKQDDPEIVNKSRQFMATAIRCQNAYKKIGFSELPIGILPSGRKEAEQWRQSKIMHDIEKAA